MVDFCEEDAIDPDDCGCGIASSDCLAVTGSGKTGNPFIFSPSISSDERQILECRDDGLFAAMAERFVWPTMRKVRDRPVPLLDEDPIPFTEVAYDPYGMSNTFEEATAPFDAKWRLTGFCRQSSTNASFGSLRLEVNTGSGFYVVSAAREQREGSTDAPTFVYHADEFFMKAGHRARFSVGSNTAAPPSEDADLAAPVVTVVRASMVMTLVSL